MGRIRKRVRPIFETERFRREELDGVADSFARRGQSKERAVLRLLLEARHELTTKQLLKKMQPARLIRLDRSC